ncbi:MULTISPECIES: TetR/AcrR family transcriptional regulator [unclassified Streptomyces]|uniref:TetR/AcrR family transcriptional regulator n=1 Tax=unclassified Streptomyces TaxID=2593676 RepID=UPI00225BFBB1|nr:MULTISPECIES: TetR/AcrR family transcriptional regulator [unclassified Streptomyces]MCX5144975.1 TetR/AcrR family transcriptional regulator [Streptomyces sp. NBC_00338]WRZ62777.1 TetR/AcrR family transcriptional regulator [Streptomyces sp. NBC_01257]WSU56743.1 TetR/AcrR family transcriptional regulator [Streptomyces sp. NBC_01104]
MSEPAARPLRADAERSVRAILEAAERVLSADPGASMEQIATAAGVARTTIHRRFTHRQALIDALASSAARQLAQAVEDGRPDTAPPMVALHRITANVLEVKSAWAFALGLPAAPDSEATALHQDIARRCLTVLERARADRLIDEAADLTWVRRFYYALLGESLNGNPDDAGVDTDTLAARIIETLLHGAGPRP